MVRPPSADRIFSALIAAENCPAFSAPLDNWSSLFELAYQSHTVFAFTLLPQFFDQLGDKWIGNAVEKLMRVLLSSTVRITGQPRALCIAVSSLDIVSSEFPLPVGEASNLLCQGQSPIGFSAGFVFSKAKSRARRTRSVLNVLKCTENFLIKSTLSTLSTLGTPFPKNFFKKLLPVEKVICVNTNWTFCNDPSPAWGPSRKMICLSGVTQFGLNWDSMQTQSVSRVRMFPP